MVTNKGIELMEKYGGSFVKALANCWYNADPINRKILEDNFVYFKEYEQKAKELRPEMKKKYNKTYGCSRCFRHFDTREEFEEHLEDGKDFEGGCPP